MKRFLFFVLFVFILGCSNTKSPEFPTDSNNTIMWRTFDETTILSSYQTGSPVMVSFSIKGCEPCEEFDKTLQNKFVIEKVNRNFIPIHFDNYSGLNSEDEFYFYTDKYRVYNFPSVIFLSPVNINPNDIALTGFLELPRSVGAHDPESFLLVLNVVQTYNNTLYNSKKINSISADFLKFFENK
jgi:hypothetical protein